MPKLPKDCSPRRIGAEARKLVHYRFSSENWEFHELTGNDNGLDCTVELVENEQFTNKKIEGQIKGVQKPHKLKNENAFTFPMDVKTVNYGLGSSNAYVLFYVSIDDEIVYYFPIQDYFIANPSMYDRLEKNKEKVNIHIPCDNIVSNNDFDLQQIAKSVYVGGPSRTLRKVYP